MGLNNLLFVWNINDAFETINTSLGQTSPLFEQYLNEAVKFVAIKLEPCIDVQFVSITSLVERIAQNHMLKD